MRRRQGMSLPVWQERQTEDRAVAVVPLPADAAASAQRNGYVWRSAKKAGGGSSMAANSVQEAGEAQQSFAERNGGEW